MVAAVWIEEPDSLPGCFTCALSMSKTDEGTGAHTEKVEKKCPFSSHL